MPETEKTQVVVRLDIPPDHHPAVIKGESPGAGLGRGALTSLYDAYGRINDTAGKVQDKARLASAAQPFAERAVQQAGRAIKTMQQQVAHLDREIATALRPAVEPSLAAQIRAHWAGTGAKALPGLRKAIEAGDAATVGAVLNAPAYLSGLSEENQGLLRAMAAEKFAPEKVAQRAETADALARVERATTHFMETMAGRLREWRDDDSKIIEEALG